MSSNTQEEPVFQDLRTEVEEGPTVVESLCTNCEENGTTKLLLTQIPHFREVIIMSFDCPHCGFRNNEVQFGGKYQEKGCRLTVNIEGQKDMNRQVVKSDSAAVIIPELDFEVPAFTQKGEITTVEGILQRVIDGLMDQQTLRRALDPETATKIDQFVEKVEEYKRGSKPFTLIVDDCSGNSNVQNMCVPNEDPQIKTTYYVRSKEQNTALGLGLQSELVEAEQAQNGTTTSTNFVSAPTAAPSKGSIISAEEADTFVKKIDVAHVKDIVALPETCFNCGKPGDCKMAITEIPYFKEIIIMAFTCDGCGYRTNEVKPGGAISEKGRRIILKVTNSEDLARDVLKSETAGIDIPEIELHISHGSLGGRFTTIEGLLQTVKDQFQNTHQFQLGDSSLNTEKTAFQKFLEDIDRLCTGNTPFTFIVDDPVANSYVQNLYAPDPDPNMTSEEYTRTWEQDEDLGLHDIKTEGYEEEHQQAPAVTTTVKPSSSKSKEK